MIAAPQFALAQVLEVGPPRAQSRAVAQQVTESDLLLVALAEGGKDVGRRLGLCAEALVYGRKVTWSGPVFNKLRVDGGKAVLSFDHVHNGLMAKHGTLTGFQIAGKDQTFHPGTAVVRGDTVVVESEAVPAPVAVRYAWHDTATASLYNKDDLPASPFRTDDWPG